MWCFIRFALPNEKGVALTAEEKAALEAEVAPSLDIGTSVAADA